MYRIVLHQVAKAGCAVLLFALVWYLLSHLGLGVPLQLSIASVLGMAIFFLLSNGRQEHLARLRLLDKGVQTPSCAGDPAEVSSKGSTVSSAQIEKSVNTALAFVRRGGPWWRLGLHSAYRLPWYFVLGASTDEPGDWLKATSLRFANNGLVAGIQAASLPYTWRFADEAVIVDARGDNTHDSALWYGLLKRLRRVRKRCPINGVIAVVHVRDLMHDDTHLVRAQAQALRERLDAMQLRFGRRFPVYVLVAHVQTLPGFSALFGNLDTAQREQFWGLTFPLRHRQTSDPTSQWSSLFRERFRSLAQRLEALLINQIIGIRDVARNADAYVFAHYMTRLEPALAQYLDEAFGYSPYAPQVMLRAVGFTAVHAQPAEDEAKRGLDGYFIEHFLRRGVFQEHLLAGQSVDSVRQQRVRQSLILTALSLLAIGAGIALWGSYQRNQALLAQADALSALIAKKAPQEILRNDPWSFLPLLDVMRDSWPLKDVTVPLSYRLGLYQGHRVETAIGDYYQSLLRQALLPVITTRLSTYLHADDTDPIMRYSCLRIYLMLGSPSHYDARAVMAWLQEDVKRWPGKPQQQSDFIAHAQVLFNDPAFKADMPLDQALLISQ